VSGYLLDTNVLSEPVRKRPEKAILQALHRISAEALYTSAICVTELRYGALRHPQGEALWTRLSSEVLTRVHILPVGEAEGQCAGDLLADLARRGEPIGIEDVLIAATAVVRGLTVATRNIRHFSRIQGLRVESWWP